MARSILWRCPDCGRTFAIALERDVAGSHTDYRRLDLLARALCGCWVLRLSDRGLARMMRALARGDGLDTGLREVPAAHSHLVVQSLPRPAVRRVEGTQPATPRFSYSVP